MPLPCIQRMLPRTWRRARRGLRVYQGPRAIGRGPLRPNDCPGMQERRKVLGRQRLRKVAALRFAAPPSR
jgi:hypothetical protein